MNHSLLIRSMVQAQDEPVRPAPSRSNKKENQATKRKNSVTREDILRYHVKSVLVRDRVLSNTNENELSSIFRSTKKPQRLPIRDAARLPEPTFNKAKHERVKKEVALRKLTKKLQQKAKDEKKQLKKSVKKQTLSKR